MIATYERMLGSEVNISPNIPISDSKFDFPDPFAPIMTVSEFRLMDWSLIDFHPFTWIRLSICISHDPADESLG